MSHFKKEYKTNSPYAEALGTRPNDKFDKKNTLINKVFKYDRDKYPSMNSFISKYSYMHLRYGMFCRENEKVSIKDFLKINAEQDKFDVFKNISFRMMNNKIYFNWQKAKRIKDVQGTFQIHDYTFFETDEYLFLHHRHNGNQYIYIGEVF